MEELLIQILGNSPTLLAVLLVYFKTDKQIALLDYKFDKKMALMEQRIESR